MNTEANKKLKPDDPEAWVNKGWTLNKLERYEEALKAYDKALELKPDDPEAWVNKGVALNKLERYEEALKACDRALELKPDYPKAWFNKGATLSAQGIKFLENDQPDEATKVFQEACQIVPTEGSCWAGLVTALFRQGKLQQALDGCAQAIERFKNDDKGTLADLWYRRGVILVKQGRAEDALAAFEKAFKNGNKEALASIKRIGETSREWQWWFSDLV